MKIFAKVTSTLISQLLVFLQALILPSIIIKKSGPEEFGAYTLLISYLGFIYGISSLGIGIKAKRILPSLDSESSRSKLYYPQFFSQIIVSTIIGIIVSISYYLIYIYQELNISILMLYIMPIYIVVNCIYSQTTDYFRYTHQLKIFNLAIVMQAYLLLMAIYLFTIIGKKIDVEVLILLSTTSTFIVSSIILTVIYSQIGFKIKILKWNQCVNEIKIGFPLTLSYIIDTILAVGDRFIIGLILSVVEVGAYSSAYVIGSIMIIIPKVCGVAITPILAQKIDQKLYTSAKKISEKTVYYFLLFAIPYALIMFIIGYQVLNIYTNKPIAETAWLVIPVVGLASIFYGLILIQTNIFFVRLQTKKILKVNMLCAISNIILNIIVISIFENIITSALITLACYIGSYIYNLKEIKKDEIGFDVKIKDIYDILIASLIMIISMIIFKFIVAEDNMKIIKLILVGFLTYSITIISISKNREEILNFIKLKKS